MEAILGNRMPTVQPEMLPRAPTPISLIIRLSLRFNFLAEAVLHQEMQTSIMRPQVMRVMLFLLDNSPP